MPSQAFRFDFNGHPSFAMGHTGDTVTLSLGQSHTSVSFRLTPYAARAIAKALTDAADFAERIEPAVPTPAPSAFDPEREAERVLGEHERAPLTVERDTRRDNAGSEA
jgi:hypothetical protein